MKLATVPKELPPISISFSKNPDVGTTEKELVYQLCIQTKQAHVLNMLLYKKLNYLLVKKMLSINNPKYLTR